MKDFVKKILLAGLLLAAPLSNAWGNASEPVSFNIHNPNSSLNLNIINGWEYDDSHEQYFDENLLFKDFFDYEQMDINKYDSGIVDALIQRGDFFALIHETRFNIDESNPDTIGFSYGPYQINSVYAMPEFLSFLRYSLEYRYLYDELTSVGGVNGARAHSDTFVKKWEELSSADNLEVSTDFVNAQYGYLHDSILNWAFIVYERDFNFNMDNRNPVVKNLLFSAVINQGSGNVINIFENIVEEYGDISNISDVEFVELFTKYRKSAVVGGIYQQSLQNRYDREENMCLTYIENYDHIVAVKDEHSVMLEIKKQGEEALAELKSRQEFKINLSDYLNEGYITNVKHNIFTLPFEARRDEDLDAWEDLEYLYSLKDLDLENLGVEKALIILDQIATPSFKKSISIKKSNYLYVTVLDEFCRFLLSKIDQFNILELEEVSYQIDKGLSIFEELGSDISYENIKQSSDNKSDNKKKVYEKLQNENEFLKVRPLLVNKYIKTNEKYLMSILNNLDKDGVEEKFNYFINKVNALENSSNINQLVKVWKEKNLDQIFENFEHVEKMKMFEYSFFIEDNLDYFKEVYSNKMSIERV